VPKGEKRKAGSYRVLRGISWAKEGGGWHDVEASKKPRKDLPAEHIAEWIAIGAIEPADTDGEEE
jgi:hypothetical protein